MQITKLLVENGKKNSEKPAIIFSGEQITFSQLKDRAFLIANFLKDKGIKKEDKVAFFLPNTPFYIYSLLGTLSAGGAIVPLDFMLTDQEIINIVKHCQAKFLFIRPKQTTDVEKIKASCPDLVEIIESRSEEDFLSVQAQTEGQGCEDIDLEIAPDQLSSIFYTSGSTGHPKGVMLNFSHFDNPVEVIDYHLELSSQDINICAGLPFSHVGGFDGILLMLFYGSTMVLMERFHPYELLKNISQYRPTLIWLVPPMYIALLSLKDYSSFDLSSLRYMVVFGAPSSPVLMNKVHQISPNAKVLNGWGMTETAAPNCVLPPGIDKIESVGKFTPEMEAKVVDPTGNTLPCGQKGHLLVKGKAVMKGYYQEPELTRDILTEDGWLKTGDIALFDQDGLCYIVGRIKDMIKVAGEIVFSSEVEAAIYKFPGVKEAAVIGIEDKLRGEVPKAFLAVEDSDKFSQEDLRGFLKKNLASFKVPHQFELVEQLPKNRAGKIDKQALIKKQAN